MGSGMPEIGSRISLISKADIRYEGKLYSVDPEECTIALSSVRSFGTEERQTGYPVPPQSQIYDYILFRGSDIKDIRVLSTTIPNDPAIVQLSVPPSMSDPFQSQPGYPPPSIGSITMPNAPSTSRQPPFQSTEFPASTTGSSIQISKPQSVSVPISEDESRSSTPSTQNAVPKNSETRTQNAKSEDQNQSQRKQYNRDNRQGQQGRYPPKQYPQQRYQQTQQRYPQQQQQQQQQQRYQNQQRYMQPQYREYRDNQYRNYDYRDNQYPQRQYHKWNNQGVRTGPQANQQHYQSPGYQNRKPKNTLKFDGDFDFEQANSQFEEVKSKLSTIKIDENAKVNGDVEIKKEDSGNEVSGEENEPDNDEKPVFYDKVKSFFDQISYEAIERSKGHTQRLDWKTERKLNSETFGPVALRRNSNFRGRPGGNFYNNYQGRNTIMANNYRGGYRQQGLNRRPGYVVGKNYDDTKENQSA